MRADVVDVAGIDARIAECAAHDVRHGAAVRLWCGGMEAPRSQPIPCQFRIDERTAAARPFERFEHEKGGALANAHPGAPAIERPAGVDPSISVR